jgi:hypothetical protein
VTLVQVSDHREDLAPESEVRQRCAAASREEPLMEQATLLYLDGEYEHALLLLEDAGEAGDLDAEGARLADSCRAALECACLAAIGSESSVLAMAVTVGELTTFSLDSTAGFLLSLVDGASSVQDVLDMAGMPRLAALRYLRDLFERGIVQVF